MFLYDAVVHSYHLLIRIVSIRSEKARLWVSGRKNWEEQLSQKIGSHHNWIWFHCSSVGEFEDSCEVFFEIQKQNGSNSKYLLTFSSPSGFELHKENASFDCVNYLPLDTINQASRFVEVVNPKAVVFSRSELWFNVLHQLHLNGIPVFLVGLKMNASSKFLKWPGILIYRKIFSLFQVIYCQDDTTFQLLQKFRTRNAPQIIGNPRFERILTQRGLNAADDRIINQFTLKGKKVLICGSGLKKDFDLLLELKDYFVQHKWRLLLVPHEIENGFVKSISNKFNGVIYSEWNEKDVDKEVLVIDHVGKLKHYFKYADFALIGGGFDKIGIHNIIEPAIYGLPVAFGPNHHNYQEALDLIELKTAFVVNKSSALKTTLENWSNNPYSPELRDRSILYVKSRSTNSIEIAQHILSAMKSE